MADETAIRTTIDGRLDFVRELLEEYERYNVSKSLFIAKSVIDDVDGLADRLQDPSLYSGTKAQLKEVRERAAALETSLLEHCLEVSIYSEAEQLVGMVEHNMSKGATAPAGFEDLRKKTYQGRMQQEALIALEAAGKAEKYANLIGEETAGKAKAAYSAVEDLLRTAYFKEHTKQPNAR